MTLEDPSFGGVTDNLPEVLGKGDLESLDIISDDAHVNELCNNKS